MSEKDTENFIVGGGVLQRNPDGSFTEVESFNMNIGRDSHDTQSCRTKRSEKTQMSIKSAFESEGIDFSQVMNPPEPWDGRALIKNINGKLWYCCPFCEKKALLISPETKIQHLKLKCKGSNCKKEFEVNV